MAKLIPVDGDPFASGPKKTPVEGDPFASVTPDLPNKSLFRMDSDFQQRAGVNPGQMLVGAAKDTFGSRQGAAEYLAGKSKGASVIEGPDGEPLLQLPDGTAYRLNDPGLDTTDIASVGSNVGLMLTPFAAIDRALKARNIGMAGRVGVQALAGAGADSAVQAAADRGRVNLLRSVASGVGGGLGEVAAPAVSRLLGYAGDIGRGSRATEGGEILRDIGVTRPTPAQVIEGRTAAKAIAAGGDRGAAIGKPEFGFQYTLGQRMSDPVDRFDQMGREEVLRNQPGVNAPFIRADQQNAAALTKAVEGITDRLGGGAGSTPGDLLTRARTRAAQIAGGLKDDVEAAYKRAALGDKTSVGIDAVKSLPDRLDAAIRDTDLELTPVTKRTLDRISGKVGNLPPTASGVTLRAIEAQRRIINDSFGATGMNATDKRALTALKSEYDQWVDDSIDNALISGDKESLDVLKEARGLRADFGRRFGGNQQADKFVADLIEGQRTPEEMLNVALGAGQVSKDAGARFISRLRMAVNDDPAVIGSLRAAQFLRMVQGRTGEQLGPQDIVNNIARMEVGNRSMIDELYTPEQWKEVKRLAGALRPFIAPTGQAKTSGSGERIIRYLSTMGGNIPFVGDMVKGVQSVKSAIDAEAVFTAPLRPKPRPTAPYAATGAATAGAASDSRQRYAETR